MTTTPLPQRNWAGHVAYVGGIAGNAAVLIAQRFDALDAALAALTRRVEALEAQAKSATPPHMRGREIR